MYKARELTYLRNALPFTIRNVLTGNFVTSTNEIPSKVTDIIYHCIDVLFPSIDQITICLDEHSAQLTTSHSGGN